MPVIGRLDRQVDDVLIKPLSKRPAADADPEQVARRPQDPPPAERGEAAADADADERGHSAGRDELPVWLL